MKIINNILNELDDKYYLIEINSVLPYISRWTKKENNFRKRFVKVDIVYKKKRGENINNILIFEANEWKNIIKKGYFKE